MPKGIIFFYILYSWIVVYFMCFSANSDQKFQILDFQIQTTIFFKFQITIYYFIINFFNSIKNVQV